MKLLPQVNERMQIGIAREAEGVGSVLGVRTPSVYCKPKRSASCQGLGTSLSVSVGCRGGTVPVPRE